MLVTHVYGLASSDMPYVRGDIERCFGQPMEPHESSFSGGYLLLKLDAGGELRLARNKAAGDRKFPEGKDLKLAITLSAAAATIGASHERLLRGVSGLTPMWRLYLNAKGRIARDLWNGERFEPASDESGVT